MPHAAQKQPEPVGDIVGNAVGDAVGALPPVYTSLKCAKWTSRQYCGGYAATAVGGISPGLIDGLPQPIGG